MNGAYDDIINLPRHVSTKHPPMPLSDRAAQFLPFAALTGFGDAIRETGRQTEEKIELDESEKAALNEKLNRLRARLARRPRVAIGYFTPDARKSGGAYVRITETVRKIDEYAQVVLLADGTKIPFDDILDISDIDDEASNREDEI